MPFFLFYLYSTVLFFCALLFPSERYIEVYEDKKWKILDLKERIVLDLKIYKYYPNFLITQLGNKYGILTDTGVNIPPQYDYIEEKVLNRYVDFLFTNDIKNIDDYEEKILI